MFGYRYSSKMLAYDKRRKSPNMTYNEKSLLVELVEEYYRVLGSKKTDGPTMQAKNVEWQMIAEQFNAKGLGSLRDSANLRCTWDNLKKAARRAAAETKLQNILADDEARKRVKLDPILERVLSLLQTSADGVANTYDVDSQSASTGEEVCVLANGSADETLVELSFEETDWSECSINTLKSPAQPALSPSTTNHGADNSDTVGTSVSVKLEAEVVQSTTNTSDEPASTSDEPIVDQTVCTPIIQNLSRMMKPAAQEDHVEKLYTTKAEAVARTMDEERKEHLWREELHKMHYIQEKLKVAILKEQLKQERLKTAKLLSELGE